MDECPDSEQLADFALGSTVAAARLADHIATCTKCSAIIAERAPMRPSDVALGAQLLAPGTMVGRYRILERLGHGGMGVVYRAIDPELDREVALKLVRASGTTALDELTERLRRESRMQARSKHPGVISVHDIGRDGDRVYVAMELARGGTLRAWLAREARPWRAIVDVFRRAGEGLAAAHAAGLVHRDFKPDNVLVEEDGERVARVLVTDFGVARAVEAAEQGSTGEAAKMQMTAAGALVGTPAYMAPEQLDAAPVDLRTDVFTFAVGLWEALYGQRPYVGRTIVELVLAMAAPLADPPRREGTPRWLIRALRRALSIDPAKRYASMAELLHALDWRMYRRRRWLVAGGTLVAGAAVAFARMGAPAPASPCDVQPAAYAELRAATARLAVAGPDVRALRAELLPALGHYLDDATRLRVETCTALPRAPNWADRVHCLDASTAGVAARFDTMARSELPRRQLEINARPPVPPFECASAVADRLAAARAPASSPQLVDIRLDLDAAVVLARTDQQRALQQLDALALRSRALGLRDVGYEIAFSRALYSVDRQQVDRVRELAAAADRGGIDDVAVTAWLWILQNAVMRNTPLSDDLLAQVDGALDRVGDPPRSRAYWHVMRGYVLATKGNADAISEIAAAEALVTKAHVPRDPDLEGLMGVVELRLGKVDAALARGAAVFASLRDVPVSDPVAWEARTRYAAELIAVGRDEDARAVIAPLLAGRTPDQVVSLDVAQAIQLTATAENQLQHYEQVEQLAERWQPAVERSLGGSDWFAGKLATEHATAALALGHNDVAERAAAHALEIYIQVFGTDSYYTADVRVLHGQVLLATGRVAAAVDELERGVKDLTATGGKDDPLTVQANVFLADALIHLGKAGDALRVIEPVLDAYARLEPDAGSVAQARLIVAKALVASGGDRTRARALTTAALSVWTADPSNWRDDIADAKKLLAKLR